MLAGTRKLPSPLTLYAFTTGALLSGNLQAHELDDRASIHGGISRYFFDSDSALHDPAASTGAPVDGDGDGVSDSGDACANTPNGTRVDARGCEIDSDRDGVVDSRDNCPDTQATVAVDANGCPILEASQRHQ